MIGANNNNRFNVVDSNFVSATSRCLWIHPSLVSNVDGRLLLLRSETVLSVATRRWLRFSGAAAMRWDARISTKNVVFAAVWSFGGRANIVNIWAKCGCSQSGMLHRDLLQIRLLGRKETTATRRLSRALNAEQRQMPKKKVGRVQQWWTILWRRKHEWRCLFVTMLHVAPAVFVLLFGW